MRTLSGQEKRGLKERGRRLGAHCHLGKDGLTDEFAAHVSKLLDRHELIKLRFEEVKGAERKGLAAEICEAAGAQCVSILGRTMLLYRPKEADGARAAESPDGSDAPDSAESPAQ